MEEIPDCAERRLIADELPKGLERRFVLRLLSYWRELCGEREFPSFAEIDPAQIPDLWVNCFVLDIGGHAENPVFRSIGAGLAEQAGMNLVDKSVSDVPDKTFIAAAVVYVDEVLRKNVPISRGGEYFTPDGGRVHYRSILLPMSDDGENVSGLLGAANCREITDEQGD